MTNKIMAVALVVSDLEVSKNFYESSLGLPVEDEDEGFVSLKTESVSLALLSEKLAGDLAGSRNISTDATAPQSIILAWDVVNDVDALFQELDAKGINFIQEPKTMSWGQRVAYFTDPDGHIWEISQWEE